MKKREDFSGQVFGRLTAIAYDRYERERTYWIFRCECGVVKSQALAQVRRGVVQSCGCLAIDRSAAATVTHGQCGTRAYKAWQNMICRCEQPSTRYFERYGGRGIVVCAKWRESFLSFYADMGEPPAGMSLDRIDNDGGYEPGNCRWATQRQQMRNRDATLVVEWSGEKVPLIVLCEEIGLSYNMARKRLRRGWTVSDALLKAPKK